MSYYDEFREVKLYGEKSIFLRIKDFFRKFKRSGYKVYSIIREPFEWKIFKGGGKEWKN